MQTLEDGARESETGQNSPTLGGSAQSVVVAELDTWGNVCCAGKGT